MTKPAQPKDIDVRQDMLTLASMYPSQSPMRRRLSVFVSELDRATDRIEQLESALTQIAEGRGTFSRDPFALATVIEETKALARKALATVSDTVTRIIVEQLGVAEEEVTPNASFIDDLNADSLDVVELAMTFEEAFNIEIPDEDVKGITWVKEAIAYIESHAKGSAAKGTDD
jgi:acyl carrier protein